MMSDLITTFAQTDWRNQKQTFGIKHEDRRQHMYVVGKTGTGKSTLLKNLIIQDIRNGHGVGVLDPHGDLVEEILNFIPSSRTNEVVYFNPADFDFPIGFNILESVDPDFRPLVASNLVSIFKNIWKDSWGPRMEYILYNSVAALLDYDGSTLLFIPKLLEDKAFRAQVVQKIKDPIVKNFWIEEYEKYNPNFRKEAISPIQNKVGQFLTSASIRNILGQVKSKIDMGFIIDNQRIFLCNLAKGKLGDDKTSLLGSLLVTKIFLASLKRAGRPEAERKDFYLYIDECQNLSTNILASILSEARKYHLNLILTHQYLNQLSQDIKESIFGNVGTLMTFRVGSLDAIELEKELSPEFNVQDLERLDRYQIYIKLLVNGLTSKPFSARTLPPTEAEKSENNKENIIKVSREKYGTRRDIVEDKINRWLEMERRSNRTNVPKPS